MSREHIIPNMTGMAETRTALRAIPFTATSARVGRTHRVVRERALDMQAARRRSRSLWLPLTIAASMLAMICYAAWTSFAQYDLTGISDEFAAILRNSRQMMVYILWFLPLTAAALVFAWRYWSTNRDDENRR